MQEKTAGGTPAAPIKLDVSVRVIEPVKNLMGFASVKFNDCFVVENLKIVQGSKGLFLGMPSQPDGKGGYRDMAYPVTKEFREQLNTAVLQAYEAKLEQMAERGSVGRASISDQLKAGKAAAEQAKAGRPPRRRRSSTGYRRRCPLWYSDPAVFRRNSRPRHSPSVCVAWFPPPFCFVSAWPEVNALHCGWAFPSEAALPLPVRQPLFRL